MQKPNAGLFPPNGYTHFDPRSGREWAGNSWADVARQIENFRRSANQEIGDPIAEIYANFCGQFPHYCKDSSAKRIFAEYVATDTGFGQQVVGWVANASARPPVNQIAPETANARAAICAACPMQRDWHGSCGCDPGKVERVRSGFFALGNIHPTPQTQALKACKALNEETSMSVWMTQAPVSKGQPANCWRLT
jgi:hypothetical protein